MRTWFAAQVKKMKGKSVSGDVQAVEEVQKESNKGESDEEESEGEGREKTEYEKREEKNQELKDRKKLYDKRYSALQTIKNVTGRLEELGDDFVIYTRSADSGKYFKAFGGVFRAKPAATKRVFKRFRKEIIDQYTTIV